MRNFCVNPTCQSPTIYFSSFTHMIFCSKPTEIVQVEIPINPGSKCCNERGVFILYEMRMNLKCYWNLPKLERGQDLDALVDTTQSFPLEIQGRGADFQSKYDWFLSCRWFSLAVVPCNIFISFLHQPDTYFYFFLFPLGISFQAKLGIS